MPDGVSYVEGIDGCRFMTAFHALVDRAAVKAGEWVVRTAAVVWDSRSSIASAIGVNVVAVDLDDRGGAGRKVGAAHGERQETDTIKAIQEITHGGARERGRAGSPRLAAIPSSACARGRSVKSG
jgi:D-arabinose 1-dehydrogenase-like Zn-dependent alcohol dehydrogenase